MGACLTQMNLGHGNTKAPSCYLQAKFDQSNINKLQPFKILHIVIFFVDIAVCKGSSMAKESYIFSLNIRS